MDGPLEDQVDSVYSAEFRDPVNRQIYEDSANSADKKRPGKVRQIYGDAVDSEDKERLFSEQRTLAWKA